MLTVCHKVCIKGSLTYIDDVIYSVEQFAIRYIATQIKA